MAMPYEEEKYDVLPIKRDAEKEYHFHYHREERLKRRPPVDPKDVAKRTKIRKIGKWLTIALAIAILVLVALFLYRFFFQ
jgi:hypothetical protein